MRSTAVKSKFRLKKESAAREQYEELEEKTGDLIGSPRIVRAPQEEKAAEIKDLFPDACFGRGGGGDRTFSPLAEQGAERMAGTGQSLS